MIVDTEIVWTCNCCGFTEKGTPPPASRLFLFLHEGGCAVLVTSLIMSVILVRFLEPVWLVTAGGVVAGAGLLVYLVDVIRKKLFFSRRNKIPCPRCREVHGWRGERRGGFA